MKFVTKYNKLKVGINGELIEFNNFEYKTTKKKEIEAIKNSKIFGVAIFEAEEEQKPDNVDVEE